MISSNLSSPHAPHVPVSDGQVTLVLPCFNEAARLDRTALSRALTDMPWLHLLCVNDGSTDATDLLLEQLRSEWPTRIQVLTLTRNSGKAEAVRRGILVASMQTPLCGFWDADLAAPLSDLGSLRAIFERDAHVEWVWGIRLRALGRQISRTALRHYLGRLFATVASAVLAVDAYDTQCGAKLFRSSSLLRGVLSEPFQSRWIFDVEMLVRANALQQYANLRGVDYVVYEAPLSTWQHRPGSKVRPTDFVRAFIDLFRIRNARAHWRRPMPAHSANERVTR